MHSFLQDPHVGGRHHLDARVGPTGPSGNAAADDGVACARPRLA
jgi:hypothetical protein